MYEIDFEPIGRRGPCLPEQSLLDCARQLSVDIVSICGGVGSCERCKVQIVSGEVSSMTLVEDGSLSPKEKAAGYRLACQTYPKGDVKVHVPPESLTAPQRTQVEGLEVDVEPDPMVKALDVTLTPPTLENPISDEVTLWDAIHEKYGLPMGTIDFSVAQMLSPKLRELEWNVRAAYRDGEIIAVSAPTRRLLGMAVDIGTTKVAAYLINLETGKTLASKGLMNPQIAFGEDVISRIMAANKNPAEAAHLQNLLVEALNQMAAELCGEAHATVTDIVDAVIVGNTAIHHLFLKLPVKQLGYAPYIPVIRSSVNVKAREIGLQFAAGAYIHMLPNVAGYVGADHIAMLLATRIMDLDGITLAIDIGTNTEICLNNNGKMASVSCASGPAFEGAHIHFGMRAAPGAIEHVRVNDGTLVYQTIGSVPPVGICGSGLLDVVAQLHDNRIVDRNGRMGEHRLIREREGIREFVLVPEEERPGLDAITLSQNDIRELQLAKGAIRMGIQVLVEAAGLKESDLDRVIVAGAFGTFIDLHSAISIGMFPPIPIDRYEQVGNAAGTGARLALISRDQRAKAEEIANRDGYIELAGVPGLSRRFAQSTFLP